MAYSTTLDQKRRETLRRQLYGKEVIKPKGRRAEDGGRESEQSHSTFSYTNQPESESSTSNHQPPTYLTRDLTKILIFSTIAIAAQLSLFFAINNHLVRLPI